MRRQAALLAVMLAGAARAEAPPVRTLFLRSPAEAIDEPLALTFDRRLTVVAPVGIRLAVPGSPDVIGVTVRDRVAVVTLVDSPFVRHERPGTNLTLLLTDGTAVALRLAVAARPAEVVTDLVHLEQGPELGAAARASAVALLKAWAAGEGEVPPEVQRALLPAQRRLDERVDELLLQRVARLGGEWQDRGGRNQSRFIYLSGDRVLTLGDTCWLRLTVANRSQPVFRIGRVAVRGAEAPPFHAPDPDVLPDERPRPLAVALPAALARAPLTVEVCEAAPGDRCVSLDLAAP